jgi:hypothetical protein
MERLGADTVRLVMLDEFEQAARRAFSRLEHGHGFAVEVGPPEAERSAMSPRYLLYRNETTFVCVELAINYDRSFTVVVGPLTDGEDPPRPIFLEREGELMTHYPLWAIMRANGADLRHSRTPAAPRSTPSSRNGRRRWSATPTMHCAVTSQAWKASARSSGPTSSRGRRGTKNCLGGCARQAASAIQPPRSTATALDEIQERPVADESGSGWRTRASSDRLRTCACPDSGGLRRERPSPWSDHMPPTAPPDTNSATTDTGERWPVPLRPRSGGAGSSYSVGSHLCT